MPVAKFKTRVRPAPPSTDSVSKAVANAAKYLAYADQTDTFGHWGKITDTERWKNNEAVVFWWQAPVANQEKINKMYREYSNLSRVLSHECISNPTNPNH